VVQFINQSKVEKAVQVKADNLGLVLCKKPKMF
jgi:hypothetical protein